MKPGDVVLDWDSLCYALGSPVDDHHTEEHPESVRQLATRLWVEAWKDLTRWSPPNSYRTWIIHANPTEWQMDRYRERGVEFVECYEV